MSAKEEIIELIKEKYCEDCDRDSKICYACPVDDVIAAIDDLPEG